MTSKEAIEKIKQLLFGSETFGMLKTKEGVELKIEGDVELEKAIYIITPDGELPAEDKEYEMEDGMKIRVKEGLVDAIDYQRVEDEVDMEETEKEKVEDENEMAEHGDEEVKMVTAELVDGTIVETDTEELKVGDSLFVVTEEGRTPAPDSDHETKDGKIVTTEDGIVVKIEEKVEVEETVEVEEELNFGELLETFTEAFNKLNSELNVMREEFDTMRENFNKFSAEPAGERIFTNKHKEMVKNKKEQQFSKLEALAALRRNKK